jgi:hypothetical protein
MIQRDVQPWDVQRALIKAASCRMQSNGRWRVIGTGIGGLPIAMSVAVEDEVIVMTILSEDDSDA